MSGVGLRRKVVEEEVQQRCLMEDACNGNKDEGSIGLCVTPPYEERGLSMRRVDSQTNTRSL